MKFVVIHDHDIDNFEHRINTMIEGGWMMMGGTSYDSINHEYIQAMFLPNVMPMFEGLPEVGAPREESMG